MKRKMIPALLTLFALFLAGPAVAEVCWERGDLPEMDGTFELDSLPLLICVESYFSGWETLTDSEIERHERVVADVGFSFNQEEDPRRVLFPDAEKGILFLNAEGLLVAALEIDSEKLGSCTREEKEFLLFVAPLGSNGLKELAVKGVRGYTPDTCHEKKLKMEDVLYLQVTN